MKIWSIIKIVIISTVGLVLLTFLTVDAPVKIEKKEVNIKDLPQTVELIGFEDQKFTTSSIIKKDTVIFVGNHESIVLANDLYKMLNLKDGQFIIVSNVSDAPWFIKRWQAHTKNEQLKGEKHLPWIYDRDGGIRNFLQVPTSDAIKYFVYKVNESGIIDKIYIGKVKVGTIDGAMSESEIKENLSEVVTKLINKN
ncbi:MAG: hypothetical protein U9N59_12465 [Campylobacterota bacterium]|nr:hypothetical protein [Campylobacterota bacterium]